MNLKCLTLIIALITSQLVYAENHLILMGGGGEPEGEDTIFDSSIFELGNSLNKTNWNYEVLYNGGHEFSEELVEELYPKVKSPTKDFTSENYTKMLKNYKLKIEKNEIKSGDQLMIVISTHGAAKEAGDISHKISVTGGAATDLSTLAGSETVNLDDLQEIIQLTNKKGIKLGIIDMSCHSGATLALKDKAPNTCIITSTGPEHFSFVEEDAFPEMFFRGLKPGLSLEEVFLKARLESSDRAYPMISTNENDNIVNEIYKNITPYLYFANPAGDKLTPYLAASSSEARSCEREDELKNLISQIDKLQSTVNSKFELMNATKLKSLLEEYKKLQDDLILSSKQFSSPPYSNIESFQPPGANKITNMTWKEILDIPTDELIYQYESMMEASLSEEEKKMLLFLTNFIKLVDVKKKEILKENPQLEKAYKAQEIMNIINGNKTLELVKSITDEEKIFYEKHYRLNQKPNPSDPCKSFKF